MKTNPTIRTQLHTRTYKVFYERLLGPMRPLSEPSLPGMPPYVLTVECPDPEPPHVTAAFEEAKRILLEFKQKKV